MSKTVYELTQEGVVRLKDELQDLKDNKRPENLILLKEARAQGDLSENADYDAARNEQGKIEARVSKIEYILKHHKIIKQTTGDAVDIGKVVTLRYTADNKERTIQLVGTLEASPAENKISVVSPLGKILLGKFKGATVMVKTPTHRDYELEIMDVK